MAIALTLLYILGELIGASTLFGPLAEYRIELILALLALLATIPSLFDSGVFASRATLALAGLCFAVVMSIAMGGWLGAIPIVGYGILPVLMGFILVAVNCKTKRHLQLVILVLVCASVFDIVQGYLALQSSAPSPYVYIQGYEGNVIPRIRGLEFLNDPNDFAQLLVSLLPLLFFFRKKDSGFRNSVLLPSALAFLLWGIYLTHSRGGTLALMATIVIAGKRKIGLIPAAVLGGVILVGALAVGASGGREISAESGADRIELWAIGLGLIKTHFFFGVGLDNFTNYAPITAHNSVVICAAELGVAGLLFWVMFILSTVRGAVLLGRTAPPLKTIDDDLPPHQLGFSSISPATPAVLSPDTSAASVPAPSPKTFLHTPANLSAAPPPRRKRGFDAAAIKTFAANPFMAAGQDTETTTLPDDEIRRLARLLLYSITGFLTAGWFLSRALSIWLFLYCGMMHAVLRLAAQSRIAPPQDSLGFLFRWSAVIAIALLVVVSLIIRFSH